LPNSLTLRIFPPGLNCSAMKVRFSKMYSHVVMKIIFLLA